MERLLPSLLKKNHWCLISLAFLLTLLPVLARAQASACPDTAAALTLAPLQEEWAVEWWIPRHEEKLKAEGRQSAKLLFLGDSITQGWEQAGSEVWHQYYTGYNAFNLGFSGDRTENVLWRLNHDEVKGMSPELTVLLIGTNNTGHRQDSPECTARGIGTILEELKERLPETRILLLAIFPREASPDGELRQLNNEINRRVENLADGERVFFLDINDTFLNAEGVLSEEIMPDFLHPNEYGYKLWAEAMEPMLRELLKE